MASFINRMMQLLGLGPKELSREARVDGPKDPEGSVADVGQVRSAARPTPQQLVDVLNWATDNNTRDLARTLMGEGHWGNEMYVETWAGEHTLYRDHRGRKAGFKYHLPSYVSWSRDKTHLRISLEGGQLVYRGSLEGVKFYPDLPVLTDPDLIAAIDDVFQRWYAALGLPGSLKPEPEGPAVPQDRAEAMRAYLAGELDFAELSRADHVLLWVDWGEDDTDIVWKCEGLLKTGALSAEWLVREATADLAITFAGKTTVVVYPDGNADRDTSLSALNGVLVAAGYELRYMRESRGSDTAAFVPLRREDWAALDAEHPDAVAARLDRLGPGVRFFD